MRIDEVMDAVGEPGSLAVFEAHWEESMASLPEAEAFLAPRNLVELREFGGLDPAVDEPMLETARRIREDPALRRLAWHCIELAFGPEREHDIKANRWPMLRKPLGELAELFYLIVALAAVAKEREAHRRMGIPEDVSRQTCSDVSVHAQRSMRLNGRWGLDPCLLRWLRIHAKGEIFRLGRIQYIHRSFRGWVRAYRDTETGDVLAVAEHGMRYDRNGWFDGDGGVRDEQAWNASLIETDDAVRGYPVAPTGAALNREVRLPLSRWEPCLRQGDPVLEMHIPEGDPLTLESSRDSLRRAAEFFPRCFPEKRFAGFACYTWLMNPQWPSVLKPESNIVRWQRQVYGFPVPGGDGRGGAYFIFWKRGSLDPKTTPARTSLERAVLSILERDEPLRGGGLFLLREHLDRYGEAHYVSRWGKGELVDAWRRD